MNVEGEQPVRQGERTVDVGRRELLQRAAWLSGAGALAWAAPAVTTHGARAAAGTGDRDVDIIGSGSPEPGSPEPGSPEPGSPEPGSPEPGSPEPGSPEPGSPEPGSPEPGSPEPGSPEPGSPEPGSPEPR